MKRPLKVAFVVVDDRFTSVEPLPRFGPAPTAVLSGFEEFPEELEVHVVCCTMGEQPAPARIGKHLHYHGAAVPKIGFLRTLHSGCIREVRRMVAAIRPDIVHAQGTERWCAVSAAWLPYPKVLTIHGNLAAIDPVMKMKPRSYWKLQTLLQKVSLPRFDGVFCNSDYTQSELAGSARRTWRVDNPLRTAFFDPPVADAAERIVILNVGLFQARKRQRELLMLAKRLWEAGVPVCFRFIGVMPDDEYTRECRRMIEEGEKHGYAEYGGVKTVDELVVEMDRARAAIHCPEEEAFGLVVAEAIARGLRFFGSAVGGINDITSGVPGCVLHAKDDWDGMAASIKSWVEAGAERNPAGVETMKERYSPRAIAGKHLEIYRELLAKKNGAGRADT
jgi:glycosyltransferase involved in cell wall biosynthesis